MQFVKLFLLLHDLEPKYQWDADYEGRSCSWMQFGGCYLGKHCQEIGLLQRKAVEIELLTEEINKSLVMSGGLSESRIQFILPALVDELRDGSSFEVDENGELLVLLNKMALDEALGRLLAS